MYFRTVSSDLAISANEMIFLKKFLRFLWKIFQNLSQNVFNVFQNYKSNNSASAETILQKRCRSVVKNTGAHRSLKKQDVIIIYKKIGFKMQMIAIPN